MAPAEVSDISPLTIVVVALLVLGGGVFVLVDMLRVTKPPKDGR